MTMLPSRQVTVGTSGAIVNLQHLTLAGAHRIPGCLLQHRAYGSAPQLRLQWGSVNYAELATSEPGVHPEGAAAFGRASAMGGCGVPTEVGFVDLMRVGVDEATDLAVAGLGPAGYRDGMLVVVDRDGVWVVPLPEDPLRLADHLQERRVESRGRDLVMAVCRPALLTGSRVPYVLMPQQLAEAVAEEWGGDELRALVRGVAAAYDVWLAAVTQQRENLGDTDDTGEAAPSMPAFQAGVVRVFSCRVDSEESGVVGPPGGLSVSGSWRDHVSVGSDRGPILNARSSWIQTPLLAAVSELGLSPRTAFDTIEQKTYAGLRRGGLSIEDSLTALPGVLA